MQQVFIKRNLVNPHPVKILAVAEELALLSLSHQRQQVFFLNEKAFLKLKGMQRVAILLNQPFRGLVKRVKSL